MSTSATIRTVRLAVVATSILVVASCGGDADPVDATSAPAVTAPASDAGETTAGGTATAPAETSTAASSATEADGTVVEVATTDLGDILVDAQGMTLYVFDNDDVDTSACTEGCLATWPPLTGDAVAAGDGVSAELGTFTRADGDGQVTVNGLPLYHYAADTTAGDLNGQGVGGVWWVVDSAGEKITDTAVGAATLDEAGYGDPNH